MLSENNVINCFDFFKKVRKTMRSAVRGKCSVDSVISCLSSVPMALRTAICMEDILMAGSLKVFLKGSGVLNR
jgi:hypothetical protein